MSSDTPKKTYKVLWFDDEYESLDGIWREARDADIELDGVSSAEEGIDKLENNYDAYDAVLVDGLFHSKKGMSGKGYNPVAAGEVGRKLSALEVSKGHIPTFLLSGQPDFRDNENGIIQTLGYDRCYDKNENLDELWKNLKKEADDRLDTQIRRRFQSVFEVCTKHIGGTSATDLLGMWKLLDASGDYKETKKFFGAIRQIMEGLFTACNRIGLVPNAFMPASAALNETGRFLGGQREVRGYGLEPDVVPRVVGDLIDAILKMTQRGSHRNAGVDEHLAIVQSPYLLQGVAYMLMDVLLWFQVFKDATHTGPFFKEVESTAPVIHTGPIERDENGNCHCGEYSIAPTYMKGYEVGDTIRIMGAVKNEYSHTCNLYPQFAKRFHKVEPPASSVSHASD